MKWLPQKHIEEHQASQCATSEKFHWVFTPDLDGLYELSFPRTGAHKKAEQCFVAASKTVLLEIKRGPAPFV